jgi:light-regulated signal transduction histidine kinase (bacteriophytochrome)
MINDLLMLSRVSTKARPFAPTDCAKVLATARIQLQVAIAECGATITEDPLPTVQGDAVQLLQLFQNLIANAIKFRGDAAPQVHVSAEATEEGWCFSVRDNGIGIAPEYFERIFLLFQRLHGRKEYPGTGIGLALCKRIVERHGGRLWVESAAGQGSTFRFTLPGVPSGG